MTILATPANGKSTPIEEMRSPGGGREQRAGESHYRELIELSPFAVLILQEQQCVFANAAAFELFGAFTPDELLGKPVLGMLSHGESDGHNTDLHQILAGQNVQRSEQQLMRLDGSIIDIELTLNHYVTDDGKPASQLVAHDISERKRTEAQVHYLAYYDQLTNLPNRQHFIGQLDRYLQRAQQEKQPFTIVALDLDHLHEINTIYGNQAGDTVLMQVAARLQSQGGIELAARFGADEFYLLLRGNEATMELVGRIAALLAEPFNVDGEPLVVPCHMGIAAYPESAADTESLMQAAVLALHSAKESDTSFVRFTREMSEALTKQHTVQTHLEHALDHEEQFLVYFQPQLQLSTRRINGVEALVRWQHPEWGLVSPGVFIPVAEKFGLIESLDEIVMRRACRTVLDCNLPDGSPLHIACNLSARQFRRFNLVEQIGRMLEETGLPPSYFEIEITESAVMENIDRGISILKQLRDLGIRLAIDDFGTGYSSLNYLARFPVQTVKIDQTFVRHCLNSPSDTAIVNAIITLAHAMDMTVLAEGVETREQLAFLCDAGCDAIQGYLFGRPVSTDEFKAHLPLFAQEIDEIFDSLEM
ncbi:MAG: putative bifunctional diguanylate cyclase/phosphodiesterase [Armatimonadota bacterium]